MGVEIRHAVARDERKPSNTDKRDWWQLRKEDFERDCSTRKLFDHIEDALAILWTQRARDRYSKRYKFTLVKVTRTFPDPEVIMTKTPNKVQQPEEARLP